MQIERYKSNPWASKYPMFHCRTWDSYQEACQWMAKNQVEKFLWSSGSHGYIFDVRGGNADWFLLRFG